MSALGLNIEIHIREICIIRAIGRFNLKKIICIVIKKMGATWQYAEFYDLSGYLLNIPRFWLRTDRVLWQVHFFEEFGINEITNISRELLY